MHEEVNQRTVALSIKTAKLTGRVLAMAMSAALRQMRKARDAPKHGKQTVKQLARQNVGLTSIPVTEENIGDFERTARKYGVDFALQRDNDTPPKLYSPVNFYLRDNAMLEEYDDVDYWRDELPHEEAWECMDQIELAIRRDRDTLNPVRGMMEYYHESESVNGKVQSLFPNIELRGDALWCVADMKLTAPLTAEETAELKEWWCGQLSDGWGEGFEQREIKVARGELYIEPWTSEKSFFIATEREFCKRLGLELRAEKPLPSAGEKPSVLAQLREAKTVCGDYKSLTQAGGNQSPTGGAV